MIYRGKSINKITVINKSNDNEVVVEMCEDEIKTTNGYEVKIDYKIKEDCE